VKRLVAMLPLRVVSWRRRLRARWRTTARLRAAWPARARQASSLKATSRIQWS
jgi:hypothetical protein